jgi:hypothetical protein
MLDTQPVLTKAWTAALLNALGDVLAQLYLEKNSKLDWKRLGIFTLLGGALIGPALHFWYGTLGRVVTASGNTGTLFRVGLDQFVWAPVFIGVIFASIAALEGNTHLIGHKLQHDLKPAVIANWKLWIPFQFLNFRLVPPHLQVLAANLVAIFWNTYMSWASHNSAAAGPPGGAEGRSAF